MKEAIHVQEAPFCLLCGEQGIFIYRNLPDRLFGAPGIWGLMRCPNCGLVWLNPRPVPEDVWKLYEQYYTHEKTKAPARLAGLRKAARDSVLATGLRYDGLAGGVLKKGLGKVLSNIGPIREMVEMSVMNLQAPLKGRLLDVGCGNGQFLATIRDLGWEVVGVEPDPAAVKAAHEDFGLTVINATLQEAEFTEKTFDVVTMNHVIEHVLDPIGTMRECRRVLKTGGRLIIATPNMESLGYKIFKGSWRGLEVPRHLHLFSPGTLLRCAGEAGLRTEAVKTTARLARLVWHESRLLRRNGVILGGNPQRLSPLLRVEGLFFWLLEYLLARKVPWGEEIVMVATKVR